MKLMVSLTNTVQYGKKCIGLVRYAVSIHSLVKLVQIWLKRNNSDIFQLKDLTPTWLQSANDGRDGPIPHVWDNVLVFTVQNSFPCIATSHHFVLSAIFALTMQWWPVSTKIRRPMGILESWGTYAGWSSPKQQLYNFTVWQRWLNGITEGNNGALVKNIFFETLLFDLTNATALLSLIIAYSTSLLIFGSRNSIMAAYEGA